MSDDENQHETVISKRRVVFLGSKKKDEKKKLKYKKSKSTLCGRICEWIFVLIILFFSIPMLSVLTGSIPLGIMTSLYMTGKYPDIVDDIIAWVKGKLKRIPYLGRIIEKIPSIKWIGIIILFLFIAYVALVIAFIFVDRIYQKYMEKFG